MNSLWTWGGNSFGYHKAGELWTFDGRHVGWFQGSQVFAPCGFYLGEVVDEDRLIVDPTKKLICMASFSALLDNVEHPPGFGFNRVPLPDGYEDFPRPARFR